MNCRAYQGEWIKLKYFQENYNEFMFLVLESLNNYLYLYLYFHFVGNPHQITFYNPIVVTITK